MRKRTANSRACRASQKKRTANNFSRVFSLCRAPYIKRTAKKFFAVRPMENARQRFSRMAKLGFPVVSCPPHLTTALHFTRRRRRTLARVWVAPPIPAVRRHHCSPAAV
jgi:hypothetical protein